MLKGLDGILLVPSVSPSTLSLTPIGMLTSYELVYSPLFISGVALVPTTSSLGGRPDHLGFRAQGKYWSHNHLAHITSHASPSELLTNSY